MPPSIREAEVKQNALALLMNHGAAVELKQDTEPEPFVNPIEISTNNSPFIEKALSRWLALGLNRYILYPQ